MSDGTWDLEAALNQSPVAVKPSWAQTPPSYAFNDRQASSKSNGDDPVAEALRLFQEKADSVRELTKQHTRHQALSPTSVSLIDEALSEADIQSQDSSLSNQRSSQDGSSRGSSSAKPSMFEFDFTNGRKMSRPTSTSSDGSHNSSSSSSNGQGRPSLGGMDRIAEDAQASSGPYSQRRLSRP